MLKKAMLGIAATAFVAAIALPVQFAPASAAAMTCKAAAKMKYPHAMKSRMSFKKDCKAKWKATQKA
jgi:hypothetical protein